MSPILVKIMENFSYGESLGRQNSIYFTEPDSSPKLAESESFQNALSWTEILSRLQKARTLWLEHFLNRGTYPLLFLRITQFCAIVSTAVHKTIQVFLLGRLCLRMCLLSFNLYFVRKDYFKQCQLYIHGTMKKWVCSVSRIFKSCFFF